MSGSNTMEVRAYSLGLGVIHVCWIIFIIVWALGVAWTKRTIYRESSAERARYWLALVIGYFLVIKSSALPPPFSWLVVPHRTSSSLGGVFLCGSGLVFEGATFVWGWVDDDAIDFPAFVAFWEIFSDRQAVFTDK